MTSLSSDPQTLTVLDGIGVILTAGGMLTSVALMGVVPRAAVLFEDMNTEIPLLTRLVLEPWLVAAALAAAGACVLVGLVGPGAMSLVRRRLVLTAAFGIAFGTAVAIVAGCMLPMMTLSESIR